MKTLTSEQLKTEVSEILSNPYRPVNLHLIFNSIKTLKDKEQLNLLLNHPRPDINKYAQKLSKINCFKVVEPELVLNV